MGEGQAKVCVACGVDCAGKPRVKDARGRYMCKACHEKSGARHAGAESAAGAMVDSSGGSGSVVATAKAPGDQLGGGEVDGGIVDVLEIAPAAAGASRPCPACSRLMGPDAVVCVSCGYDARAGFQRGTGVGASESRGGRLACPSCGYSLKGLKKPACPECGAAIRPMTKKEELRAVSRETVKWAYLKPAILFGVAVAGLAIMALARGRPEDIVGYAIMLAMFVPVGVIAFLICGAIWIGFNSPIHLIAIQLAGIYAMVAFVGELLSLTRVPILPSIAALIVQVHLMMDQLDLDMQDAIIVSVITGVLRFGAVLAVAMVVASL